jgi:hypothetical protein
MPRGAKADGDAGRRQAGESGRASNVLDSIAGGERTAPKAISAQDDSERRANAGARESRRGESPAQEANGRRTAQARPIGSKKTQKLKSGPESDRRGSGGRTAQRRSLGGCRLSWGEGARESRSIAGRNAGADRRERHNSGGAGPATRAAEARENRAELETDMRQACETARGRRCRQSAQANA